MATESISRQHNSGQNLYAVLWYQATYFNWSAAAWQSPATGTYAAAAIVLTEYSLAANAQSLYQSAAVELSPAWNRLAPREAFIAIYVRAGGSPNPATDVLLDLIPVRLQAGRINPVMDITLVAGHQKDVIPRVASFWLSVSANGEPVDCSGLDDADLTCDVVVRREGDSADFLTAEAAEPEADGRYYVTFETPDYTADRTYMCRVNIGSGTLIRDVPFYAAG